MMNDPLPNGWFPADQYPPEGTDPVLRALHNITNNLRTGRRLFADIDDESMTQLDQFAIFREWQHADQPTTTIANYVNLCTYIRALELAWDSEEPTFDQPFASWLHSHKSSSLPT